MIQGQTLDKKLTSEEYLTYDDGTDTQYELVDGNLVEMPPERTLNARIAIFLLLQFAKLVPFNRICHKDAEIQVSSSKATFRIPDLMILSEAGKDTLTGKPRNTITLDMPPPLLVVEVVSADNPSRDFLF